MSRVDEDITILRIWFKNKDFRYYLRKESFLSDGLNDMHS
jgi:hypothetical protein